MKAFVHVSLLTLLFVTSAISQSTNYSSTVTASSNTTLWTTPTVTNTPTTPTPTPAGTNSPTTSSQTPAGTNSPATSSQTPAGTNAPATPPPTPAATNAPATPLPTPAATNAPATPPPTPAATNAATDPTATTITPIATTSSSVMSPGVCGKDSCSDGASCVSLNNLHFCLCVDGYYYNSSTCNKGKVFPGTIKVNVSETSGLGDEKSLAYQTLYEEITKFFKDAFSNPDYGQTVIHKVRIPALARSEVRAGDQLVTVTVVNLFAENSEENETTISNAINKAVENNRNTFSGYTTEDRCELYGCVKENEQDDCKDILQCKCKPGLSRPNPQTALCLALVSKCSDTCNAEHNMQCVVRSSNRSDCVCLPGYQKDAQESCQACPFGYSGVNCEDKFQLILTIVGTIAGILILGMVIALIFLRSKKNKGIEEQNLIEDEFQSKGLSAIGFSNLGAEGSIFPKVRATFSKDNIELNPYSQNPYSQRSMPRPDY